MEGPGVAKKRPPPPCYTHKTVMFPDSMCAVQALREWANAFQAAVAAARITTGAIQPLSTQHVHVAPHYAQQTGQK